MLLCVLPRGCVDFQNNMGGGILLLFLLCRLAGSVQVSHFHQVGSPKSMPRCVTWKHETSVILMPLLFFRVGHTSLITTHALPPTTTQGTLLSSHRQILRFWQALLPQLLLQSLSWIAAVPSTCCGKPLHPRPRPHLLTQIHSSDCPHKTL